jgi:four helix bundle protein
VGEAAIRSAFRQQLTDSDGENHEVEHWLLTALEDGYLAQKDFVELLELKREVGRMLGGMIQDPKPFLLRSESSG